MSKLVACSVLVAILCTAHVARADDTDQGPKDPNTALGLSLGGTAASVALTIAGASANNSGLVTAGLLSSIVTPSFGEWYAGKPLTVGLGLRAASAVALVAGANEAFKCFGETGSCSNDNNAAGVLLLGGLVGYATGTIYDIATAPRAAREFNAEHQVHVTPTYLRSPSGSATMGVGIGGTF